MAKIIIDTNHPVTNEAAKKWSLRSQMNILVEECSEVIKAVSKFNRALDNKENLKEVTKNLAMEMADVNVSAMSVIKLLHISSDIEQNMEFKIKRLKNRMRDIDKGILFGENYEFNI